MKQQNAPPNTSPEKRSSIGRYLYMGYITACMSVMLSQPASAATIWEKASEIMQDVYSQILAISTIAAISFHVTRIDEEMGVAVGIITRIIKQNL